MDPELDSLVLRLRARDADAIAEVYARFHRRLFRFLAKLSGQHALAEDLFQETWLCVARDASRLREGSDLEAWLFAVARNRYRSHRRASYFDLRRLLGLGREPVEVVPSHEGEVEARQRGQRAQAAFASLSPAFREVLLLSIDEGLPAAQVGAALGLTPEAVRQRVHRARQALAEVLRTEALRAGEPETYTAVQRGTVERGAAASEGAAGLAERNKR